MATWKKLLLASVITLVLLFGFVTLILPGMIVDRATRWVGEETGRALKIGALNINPFGLTVTIRDLALSELDPTQPFIAWQELHVSLSPASLYHLAPVIDELRLEQPRVQLERLSDNRFNFSDLLPTGEPPQAPGSGQEPARFSINNLIINGGEIDLVDHSREVATRHRIRKLHLALPALGNLPHLVENPVQPLLQAEINDAPLEIKGEAKPFARAVEMRVLIELYNIDLPEYLAYVPVELPVRLNNGLLSLDLELRYRATDLAAPELVVSGQVDLASLDIQDRLGEPLFFLPLLQTDIAPSHPLANQVHLTSLRVYNLAVHLNRDQQGIWNHSRLTTPGKAPNRETSTQGEADQPFALTIDDIWVRDGELHFSDRLPPGGFKTVARKINIDIRNFALDNESMSPLTLALATDYAETVRVSGSFRLAPLTLDLQTEADAILLAAYQPYYQPAYAAPIDGTLGIRAHLSIDPQQPLLVSSGTLAFRNLYGPFNENEGIGIDQIDITGLQFDLGANRLAVGSVVCDTGRVNFSRDPSGHWSFFSRNFPILDKLSEAPRETPATPGSRAGEESAFSYRVDQLAFKNLAFDIHDRLPATPTHLRATAFNLSLRNLAAPEKVVSSFDLSTRFQDQGAIQVTGTVALADQTIELKSRLSNIPLASFAPYVAEQTNLVLRGGRFDATLGSRLEFGERTQIIFDGDIGIRRFHLLDGIHREDLLKWNNLQIARLSGRTEPLTVHIESITLSDYFVKLLLDEQQRLNLVEALGKETVEAQETGTETGASQPAAAPAAPDPAATSPPAHHFRIDTLVLQGGEVDFTDRSLPKTFHADMTELGGRVTGLDSAPQARAEVDLRGSLRNQSPLTISGTVNPLADRPFLDLELNFRDIELSPMSPYSGTYVGYLIEKGKLNLAMKYHLEDGRLNANNAIFLDQFTFGAAVESDRATSLPVKLAVALLKDRRGEIHLDIPITGSLDDPQFSITGVIWRVIRNLLMKAATAPLALLGALFGSADEDFSSLNFAYGSARMPPPELEKLGKFAAALKDRPELEIEIKGFVDPDNDPEGYRREQLRLKVQRLKALDQPGNGKPAEEAARSAVEISPEEYPGYLWEVYKDADFPKPRNFIGMLKKLPVEEQEKLIFANTPVGEAELANLAQARAQAVQSYLVKEAGLDPSRVFLTRPDILAPPAQADANRSRVEFNVKVR